MLRRSKTWLLALATAIVPGAALSAGDCGEGEVTFLAATTPNLTAEMWSGLIARFNEQHPDITIRFINSAGQPHEEYARMLLATGSFPDVATSMAIDRATFFKPDVLMSLPLDDIARRIKNIESETVNGHLFAYTPHSQPVGLVYYNKEMFAAAGITDDMLPPANLEEFDALLYKLRDAGMTAMGATNSWSAGWAYFQIAQASVFSENPDWYVDRAAGEVTFAGSAWEQAAERFARWAADGIIDPDALSTDYASGQQKFLDGKVAIWVMGSFFAAAAGKQDFEIGVFPAPTESGEQVLALRTDPTAISVSAKADPQAASLCFAQYLGTDPEATRTVAQADSLFSNLVSPLPFTLSPLQEQIAEFVATLPSVSSALGRGANQPVPGLLSEYAAVAEAMMQGSITAADAMRQLDEYWDSQSQ